MSTTRSVDEAAMRRAGRAVMQLATFALIACGTLAAPAFSQSGDKVKGAEIYARRCAWCHGEKGDGQGPGAARLVPPPRDFTFGLYKIKSSGFDEIGAREDDLVRMIRDGMPGTSMPGWKDVLSGQDIRDVTAHIGTFVELEKPKKQVDYGTQIATSAESVEQGRKLFLEGDRCSECHGKEGKGDGIKSLKDDAGYRTWPRNLTKPWTFRASNDPKDIFARITNGIPGTQMPSFVDPASKDKLTIEQRWHIANYVASLGKTGMQVRPERTVIRAAKLEGEVPATPEDARWKQADPATFFLVPQLIAKERFFTPSNDTVTVRALYGDKDIALLLEWDDRTKSTPGDERAEKISDPGIAEDRIAVQLPVEIPKGMEKPYFVMGDAARAVTLWQWSSGTTTTAESAALALARGIDKVEARAADAGGLTAKGVYRDGTWRVVMKRPLAAGDPKNDIRFAEGVFIPIAFSAWDGSNGEKESRHTLTTWYWLLLEPPRGNRPLFAALGVFLLVLGGEAWWARAAAARRPRGS
jgi:DMSO reductase family type II enzyme heme b subunit